MLISKKATDDIHTAQIQKLEHISRKLMLKEGDRLLDIGSGWGSMLIYAAKRYKVKGYGVTLSKEQLKYAKLEAKKQKVDHLVSFELKDYRDIKGEFDKVVSIGMFEHVGTKFYPKFFQIIKDVVKPGGICLLHTIGRFTLRGNGIGPWASTYIFPGGVLPKPEDVTTQISKHAMELIDFENLRMHYHYTLNHWKKSYAKVFDETAKKKGMEFARMWKLYLYAASANFKSGNLHLFQFTFTNGTNNELPLTREHIYSK